MNAFDSKIREAKKQQRGRILMFALLFVFSIGLISAVFAYVNGTSVKISPEDAELAGKIQVSGGFGVSISNVVYSLTSETQITVSARGFKSELKTLTSADKGRTVDITLQELPGHLVAKVLPVDDAARWSLNGKRIAIASSIDLELVPGSYTLTVASSYFEDETIDFDVRRAEEISFDIKLKPVRGQLSISSDPAGAKIKIDGLEHGETPTIVDVVGGRREVMISLAGYQTIKDAVEITRTERTAVRDYMLLRQPSELSLNLKPDDGVLLVNGQKTDLGSIITVPSGVENTINYSRPGYISKTKTVVLEPREVKRVDLELKPEYGEVEIISKPVAEVYINDKKVGESPLTLDLLAVPQTIALRKQGYRTITKKVTPSGQEAMTVREILQTEKTARLMESPPVYTNSVGIELIMFKPVSIKMGAPRHEKGQRANEFVRRVNFSKPFYAAKYETTNQQFRAFDSTKTGSGGARDPVTSVSWIEAVAFCNWLSEKENLRPFYAISGGRARVIDPHGNGYRLLTEPEWEWLARKANRSVQTIFTWGDTSTVPEGAGNIADEAAKGGVPFFVPNYSDGYSAKAPVGQFKAEPSGLYDLSGNVSEWVNEAYILQPPAINLVESDPVGSVRGTNHVVKGSNWRSGTRTTLRAAFREGVIDRRDDIGFRIGRYL